MMLMWCLGFTGFAFTGLTSRAALTASSTLRLIRVLVPASVTLVFFLTMLSSVRSPSLESLPMMPERDMPMSLPISLGFLPSA